MEAGQGETWRGKVREIILQIRESTNFMYNSRPWIAFICIYMYMTESNHVVQKQPCTVASGLLAIISRV